MEVVSETMSLLLTFGGSGIKEGEVACRDHRLHISLFSQMTKTLYTFGGSIWSAAPELAIVELGYQDGLDVTTKVINLFDGENCSPSFLELNPNGTLPTLESDGRVYTNTTDVIALLVKDAPVKIRSGSASIIETIHEEQYDPNFAMFLARSDEELNAKSKGIHGVYVSRRQPALERYSQETEAAKFKAFYDEKLALNTGMSALFAGKAPADAKAGYFARSEAHFASVKTALFEVFPKFLPDNGFIGGPTPGEEDFHLAPWLTRIAATSGATSSSDALAALEVTYGAPVPAKVAAYWGAWTARVSWKKVYADSLR
ncbi:hypothetical protein DFH07DRAFT_858227 [Mycena maculata]|uniref:GST N-terminal domain-containing protein n=1 Tax=Mycena maculata TaxID=230809 RepID=A0AAD7HIQ8_9AGAR|nr:hypothetical protein DFH07DRAFT_858227 [Mycena maculata]